MTTGVAIDGGIALHSPDWSGTGRIYGVTKKTIEGVDTIVRRRVDLYFNGQYGKTGKVIASTLSRESDGYYEFINLKINSDPNAYEFSVVVSDWPPSSTVQESEIARWVRPTPM